LGIFVFLRRRVHPALAVAGMLLPVTVSAAYAYAFEVRGYGIVLAFSAAAVVCWDFLRDLRWRRPALIALPLCLAAAISTHLYAVLVIVPLALAELVGAIERRKVDWWPWVGLAVSTLVLLPANPVIVRIRSLVELTRYAARPGPSWSELVELLQQFLSMPATYLGLLTLVCLYWQRVSTEDRLPSPTRRAGQPSPADWVLAVSLAGLPVIGWVLANLVTGLLVFRYVISAVIGFSLIVPMMCQKVAARRRGLPLLLAAWVAVTAAGVTHSALTSMFSRNHIAVGLGCFRLLKL